MELRVLAISISYPCPPFSNFVIISLLALQVTFMEMLAMELKGDGVYVARGLSFA